MTRYILGVTLLIFIAVLGTAFWLHITPQSSANTATVTVSGAQATLQIATSTSSNATTNSSAANTNSGYTMADVAKHNSASSCWTAINGNVYDVTKWINQHPGGPQAILSLCGTDGSTAFNGQHGGDRRPAHELASFLLGPLAK